MITSLPCEVQNLFFCLKFLRKYGWLWRQLVAVLCGSLNFWQALLQELLKVTASVLMHAFNLFHHWSVTSSITLCCRIADTWTSCYHTSSVSQTDALASRPKCGNLYQILLVRTVGWPHVRIDKWDIPFSQHRSLIVSWLMSVICWYIIGACSAVLLIATSSFRISSTCH